MTSKNITYVAKLHETARVLAQSNDKKLAIVLLLDDENISIGMHRIDTSVIGEDIREALSFAIHNSYIYSDNDEVLDVCSQ
jgi:hypothetical protein